MQTMLVKADMLQFLSRLQPGFCSITLNGIDAMVLNDHEYWAALSNEMARVVPLGKLVFGVRSFITDSFMITRLRRFRAVSVPPAWSKAETEVFERIEGS